MIRTVRRPVRRLIARAAFAVSTIALPLAAPAQTVYSLTGIDAFTIMPAVTGFRSALGTLNPNVAGSFGSGRREVNWDGVPDMFAAPNVLPAGFFNANSPRGVVFSTPGTGFQVSANSGVAPVRFGNIDASYGAVFEPFSAQRLFTAIGSNIVDVNFFVPGSSQAALSRGFGAVLSDVDLAATTSLTFFGAANDVLGSFFALASPGSEHFSFLGVDFGSAVVSRVRITNGNQIVGGPETGDLVVMDDFIYGEPFAAAVPEPEVLALMMGGLAALGWRLRRRQGGAIKRLLRAGGGEGCRSASS